MQRETSVSPLRGKKTFNVKDNDSFINYKQEDERENQKTDQNIVSKIRQQLKAKSEALSVVSLLKQFAELDNSNKRSLGESQFLRLIKNLQLNLTDSEIKRLYLFEPFQRNREFNYDRFVSSVFSSVNEHRESMIQHAFQNLDTQQNNSIKIEYLIDQYDPMMQPDVKNGKQPAKNSLQEYLRLLHDYCKYRENPTSTSITHQQFCELYKIISFFIESDRAFEQIMIRGWKNQPNMQQFNSYQDNEDGLLEAFDSENFNEKQKLDQFEEHLYREERILNSAKQQRTNNFLEFEEQILAPPPQRGRSVTPNQTGRQKSDIFHINAKEPTPQKKQGKNTSSSPKKDRYNIINHNNNPSSNQENQQQLQQKQEAVQSKKILSSPFSSKFNIISNTANNQSNQDEYDYTKKNRGTLIRQLSHNNILSHENNPPLEENYNSGRKRQKSPFNPTLGNILAHVENNEGSNNQLQERSGRKKQSMSPFAKNFNIITNQNSGNKQNNAVDEEQPTKRLIQKNQQPDNKVTQAPAGYTGQYQNPQSDKKKDAELGSDRQNSYRYDDFPLGSMRKGKRSVTPSRDNNFNIINNQENSSSKTNSHQSSYHNSQRSHQQSQQQQLIQQQYQQQYQQQQQQPNQNFKQEDRTQTKVKQEREREDIRKYSQSVVVGVFLKKITDRGPRGFLNFWSKLFNIFQQKGSCIMNYEEFQQIMLVSRLDFSNEETEMIFNNFDKDKSSMINGYDILQFFRGKGLNKARLGQITKVYNTINQFSQSKPSYQKILDSYKPKNSVDALKKVKVGTEQLLVDFIENFDNHHMLYNQNQRKNEIELNEFISFNSLYSIQYEEDNQFESYLFQSFSQ